MEVNGGVARGTAHGTGLRGAAELVDHFHLLLEDGEWKIISRVCMKTVETPSQRIYFRQDCVDFP